MSKDSCRTGESTLPKTQQLKKNDVRFIHAPGSSTETASGAEAPYAALYSTSGQELR